jgi:hypothetical protein
MENKWKWFCPTLQDEQTMTEAATAISKKKHRVMIIKSFKSAVTYNSLLP